jgi:serine/threonine protein kinase
MSSGSDQTPTTPARNPAASDSVDFEVIVDHFDHAWRTGPVPSIPQFLDLFDADRCSPLERRQLLLEMVKVDMEYRWRPAAQGRDSERPPAERWRLGEYLSQMPQLVAAGGAPIELIAEEYFVRQRFGDRPEPGELIERFSQQAAAIRAACMKIDEQLQAEKAAGDSRHGSIWIEPPAPRSPNEGTRLAGRILGPDEDSHAPGERTLFDSVSPTWAADADASDNASQAARNRPDSERFLQILRESQIVAPYRYDDIVARAAEHENAEDPRSLAVELVARGLITDYQADALLRGEARDLVLGEYVVLTKIGEGGMGAVYKARHRLMDRLVALKVLSPAVTRTPEGLRRFHREVQTAARLNHPNIVVAHDAREDSGKHYLVMELVDGINLRQILRQRGPLPVAEAIDYTLQAAHGLMSAHAAGIIHRDIKPDNLLLTTNHVVKILDLGLARLSDTTPREGVTLTGTGSIVGTPEFMAPEQAVDARTVDERADIYSLGCTLHFMLTGRPPYEAESVFERLMAHRDRPIPSLCARRKDAPDRLDRLFQRMLAKDAHERPATVAAVAAELEAIAASPAAAPFADATSTETADSMQPTDATPPTSRFASFTGRRAREIAFAATLAACVAMLAYRIVLAWQ